VTIKYGDARSLCRATVTGLQALEAMSEYYIVDASGVRFDLRQARPEGARWSPFRRVVMGVLNPVISIEFADVSKRGRVALADLKDLICRDIDQNLEYWLEVDDPAGRKERVQRAADIAELFSLF